MKIYGTGKKILVYKLQPILNNLSIGSTVVDIGCGAGNLVRYLTKLYPKINFIGEDIHEATLNAAKEWELPNIKYVLAKGNKLPFNNNSIDLAYCNEVIEHILDDKLFVREMNRILKINSYLIITTPNKNTVSLKSANPDHKRHYSPSSIRRLLLNNGFTVDKINYSDSKISRGVDNLINSLTGNLFKSVMYQPCLTTINKKDREKSFNKLIFLLADAVVNPIISIIAIADNKINGEKEKYNMLVVAKKINEIY